MIITRKYTLQCGLCISVFGLTTDKNMVLQWTSEGGVKRITMANLREHFDSVAHKRAANKKGQKVGRERREWAKRARRFR